MTQIQTSTQPNLRTLAKAGDPKAIATLLNQSLQPKGITARAIVRENCLKIILAGQDLPQEVLLAPHLEKALYRLAPEAIASVDISGFRPGLSRPSWVHRIDLTAPQVTDEVGVKTDLLGSLLSDLDPALVRELASALGITEPDPNSKSTVIDVIEQILGWRQQAQTLSEAEIETLPEEQLFQMALALGVCQLSR